ncbi:MAG: 16S rRNA (cytosine(1402)-N(4))-methyltransferase RsmH [Gemmatirosa sp.]|nr:16S rRNA (cytosine(1402)-N(4))-methyltransferase RsmH [Gemmatirosa sp.]
MDRGARWDSAYHAPVMAAEIVRLLSDGAAAAAAAAAAVAPRALDGTLGGGGHSLALLEAGFDVVGIDRDPQAIAEASSRLASHVQSGRFRAVLANYADVGDALPDARFEGVLLDLGISSHQIDDTGRGFSFREGAPLDMRMGTDARADAATWLNESAERELATAFRAYADEPRSARLAREIVRRRATRAFATSDDLVGAIRGALGPRTDAGDFARLFQAVRIAVNDELAGLTRALPALRDRLAPGGRLAVISYHSGEDRVVKHTFREWSAGCICPPRQPVCTCGHVALGETITRRAVDAAEEERARNPRARSAHLRVWQRGSEGAA